MTVFSFHNQPVLIYFWPAIFYVYEELELIFKKSNIYPF